MITIFLKKYEKKINCAPIIVNTRLSVKNNWEQWINKHGNINRKIWKGLKKLRKTTSIPIIV